MKFFIPIHPPLNPPAFPPLSHKNLALNHLFTVGIYLESGVYYMLTAEYVMAIYTLHKMEKAYERGVFLSKVNFLLLNIGFIAWLSQIIFDQDFSNLLVLTLGMSLLLTVYLIYKLMPINFDIEDVCETIDRAGISKESLKDE